MQVTRITKHSKNGASSTHTWSAHMLVFVVCIMGGYGIGYMTRDFLITASVSTTNDIGIPSQLTYTRRQLKINSVGQRYKGDTIHSILTSSGDAYQNFQTRIMYASYKLVQKQPGGERLTGFTRILHRTLPDILMDELPTFMAKPDRPECDNWCDYPVANRPGAIKQFFDAVALNESMIQGAWVFMLECDYVWMRPMQVPGDAYDPSVPGVQFLYDYIIPDHPNALPAMNKLYAGPVKDIPPSGPSPVLLRLREWQVLVADYVKYARQVEVDPMIKKSLDWVREMYAWDVAVAMHPDIKVLTEHPPNSSTIVQPPFDTGLGRGCLCHYTWGALYHEGLPSKGAKQAYRWEKRDFNDIRHVLKVPNIPMPPPYKEGWILEFDAPLTRPRHDLVVLMLEQMNKAINTLPDLNPLWPAFQVKLAQMKQEHEKQLAREAALAATSMITSSSRR